MQPVVTQHDLSVGHKRDPQTAEPIKLLFGVGTQRTIYYVGAWIPNGLVGRATFGSNTWAFPDFCLWLIFSTLWAVAMRPLAISLL